MLELGSQMLLQLEILEEMLSTYYRLVIHAMLSLLFLCQIME